MAERRRTSSRI